jgi:ribosomal protein S18
MSYGEAAKQTLTNAQSAIHSQMGQQQQSWNQQSQSVHQKDHSIQDAITHSSGNSTAMADNYSQYKNLQTKIDTGLKILGSGAGMSVQNQQQLGSEIKQANDIADRFAHSDNATLSDTFSQSSSQLSSMSQTVSDSISTSKAIQNAETSGYDSKYDLTPEFNQYMQKNGATPEQIQDINYQRANVEGFKQSYVKDNFGVDVSKYSATAPDIHGTEQKIAGYKGSAPTDQTGNNNASVVDNNGKRQQQLVDSSRVANNKFQFDHDEPAAAQVQMGETGARAIENVAGAFNINKQSDGEMTNNDKEIAKNPNSAEAKLDKLDNQK